MMEKAWSLHKLNWKPEYMFKRGKLPFSRIPYTKLSLFFFFKENDVFIISLLVCACVCVSI